LATIENRSRFSVTVKSRPDLSRFSPFAKFTAVQSNMDDWTAQNLKPRADQLDEHWLVRLRQTGYKTSSRPALRQRRQGLGHLHRLSGAGLGPCLQDGRPDPHPRPSPPRYHHSRVDRVDVYAVDLVVTNFVAYDRSHHLANAQTIAGAEQQQALDVLRKRKR
jgi:hypothetical protein